MGKARPSEIADEIIILTAPTTLAQGCWRRLLFGVLASQCGALLRSPSFRFDSPSTPLQALSASRLPKLSLRNRIKFAKESWRMKYII
jgi:hypothetical protein